MKTKTTANKEMTPKKVGTEAPDLSVKKKMVEVAFAQIDKQYGNGAVMLLGKSPHIQIEAISTGSILIDQAIGSRWFASG